LPERQGGQGRFNSHQHRNLKQLPVLPKHKGSRRADPLQTQHLLLLLLFLLLLPPLKNLLNPEEEGSVCRQLIIPRRLFPIFFFGVIQGLTVFFDSRKALLLKEK